MDVDEIASRLEIEHVLTLYCLGVDAGDAEAIKQSFHPDATDEHGPFQGLGWSSQPGCSIRPSTPKRAVTTRSATCSSSLTRPM